MKTKKLLAFTVIAITILFISCKKSLFEPTINGTWVEINNTTDQVATGCELVVDEASGDVTLCGFNFVHPRNSVSALAAPRSKLVVGKGQMYYKQKTSSFLWIAPIGREDLYFMDYDFEGQFLWIVGENTNIKSDAKGSGRVFKKK